jgi:prophage antirepressor-like protein
MDAGIPLHRISHTGETKTVVLAKPTAPPMEAMTPAEMKPPRIAGLRLIQTGDLVEFNFESHRVRVTTDASGASWWVAKDVCEVLGYAEPSNAVARHCKYAKLFKRTEMVGLESGPPGVLIIPESDLYRLIMGSKLPDAEEFQDWVVEEVPPQIRKTGCYAIAPVTVEKLLADTDLLIQLATGLRIERAKRLEVEEDQRKLIEEKDSVVEVVLHQVRQAGRTQRNQIWSGHGLDRTLTQTLGASAIIRKANQLALEDQLKIFPTPGPPCLTVYATGCAQSSTGRARQVSREHRWPR